MEKTLDNYWILQIVNVLLVENIDADTAKALVQFSYVNTNNLKTTQGLQKGLDRQRLDQQSFKQYKQGAGKNFQNSHDQENQTNILKNDSDTNVEKWLEHSSVKFQFQSNSATKTKLFWNVRSFYLKKKMSWPFEMAMLEDHMQQLIRPSELYYSP